MADWKHDKQAKTWAFGDRYLIRHGYGPGRKDLYHCYVDGKYVAQETTLEGAKAKAKAAGTKKEG